MVVFDHKVSHDALRGVVAVFFLVPGILDLFPLLVVDLFHFHLLSVPGAINHPTQAPNGVGWQVVLEAIGAPLIGDRLRLGVHLLVLGITQLLVVPGVFESGLDGSLPRGLDADATCGTARQVLQSGVAVRLVGVVVDWAQVRGAVIVNVVGQLEPLPGQSSHDAPRFRRFTLIIFLRLGIRVAGVHFG